MNVHTICRRVGPIGALALCAAAICTAPALANRAPIERPQVPRPMAATSPVKVVVQEPGAPMRIEIPASLLGQGAKGVLGAAGPISGPEGTFSVRTLIAGVSLSMALGFGGLWFARRRSGRMPTASRTQTVGLLVGVGLLGGLIASVVHADVAPGPPRIPPPPKPTLTSQVVVVPAGNEIKIHLSEQQIRTLRAEWTKTAKAKVR